MKFKVTKIFLSKLSTSLLEDVSDNNRKTWTKFIIENNIPVMELVDMVLEKHPVGMRFMWMMGDLADTRPEMIASSVKAFYEKRGKVTFANYERSLAKLFYLAGIPKEIEGEAINDLFKWLTDANSNVTTKTFALLALQEPVKKYPDLKNELKAIVEDQLEKTTVSFKQKARKVLAGLN